MSAILKSKSEIALMRRGGRKLAAILNTVSAAVKPGVSTSQLAELAGAEAARLGCQPAFLGYNGFPAPICISVNDEVVHGIPGSRILTEGDIVGLDFGVEYEGLITDGAVTVGVGKLKPAAAKLLEGAKSALAAGIAEAVVGHKSGAISAAIEKRLRADNLGIIKTLSGHGVGFSLHEDPPVPNYGRRQEGIDLRVGMTLAIEPMATLGGSRVKVLGDKWTIATSDSSLAAQFEHTVAITASSPEILTAD